MRGPYKWVLIGVLPVVIALLIGLRFCDRYAAACSSPGAQEGAEECQAHSLHHAAQKYSNDYAVSRDASKFSCQCTPAREKCPAPCGRTNIRELKAACFVPTSSRIRKIYSNAMGLYGLELSYQTWDWLYPWLSASVLSQSGSSIGAHNHTRATLVPFGLGLKYMWHYRHSGVYVGAGPLYSYLRMRDHSRFVNPSCSRWDWGGIAKVGLILFSNKAFVFDIFTDYSYMKFDFDQKSSKVIRHDVTFSGFSVGGALGVAF